MRDVRDPEETAPNEVTQDWQPSNLPGKLHAYEDDMDIEDGFPKCSIEEIKALLAVTKSLEASQETKFEDSAAKETLKFEVAYIVLETAGLGLFFLLGLCLQWPTNEQVRVIWAPVTSSIVLRVLALIARRCHDKFPVFQASLVLMVFDVTLLTSCHPEVNIWKMADGYDPTALEPALLLSLQGNTDLAALKSLTRLRALYFFQFMLVMYAMQVLLWYTVTFTLLFRHAVVGLVLAFVTYTTTICAVGQLDGIDVRVLEFAMLAFSIGINLAAKRHLETSQRDVFGMMERKSQEAVKEKVLRFQAEYKEDRLRDCLTRKPCQGADSESSAGQSRGRQQQSQGLWPQKPPSQHSAPPAVLSFLAQAATPGQCSTRQAGDCLPPSAMVWVEGRAFPMEVQHVASGQQVLCYDNLGNCLRYAEVSGVHVLPGNVNWVSVALTDGTALTMTADHPIQPQQVVRGSSMPQGRPSGCPVRAADLTPGSDCLMVLRMVPIPVASVTQCQAEVPADAPADEHRVALTLRQPGRHSVFVAAPGSHKQAPTMAVASADLSAWPADSLVVRRTFLEVQDGVTTSIQRANSAPASFLHAVPTLDGVQGVPGDQHVKVAKRRLDFRSHSESEVSSERSPKVNIGSGVDGHSGSSGVVCGASTSSDRTAVAITTSSSGTARLSTLVGIKQSGLPSIGSVGHEQGNCRVCVFENRRQHSSGGPCFKGFLCERCHEPHEALGKRRHKSGAMRRWCKAMAVPRPPRPGQAAVDTDEHEDN